jgi:hypothetical protein
MYIYIYYICVYIYTYMNLDYGLLAVEACSINITGTFIAFIIGITISVLCISVLVRHYVIRCLAKKNIWIFTNDSRSLFPVMFIIAQIWSISFSIQMIMYNKKRIIKFDLGSTICSSAALLFTQFGLISYFFVILNFLKSYTYSSIATTFEMDQTNKRFNRLILIAQSSSPIFIILAILPLFHLEYPQYGIFFMRVVLIVTGVCGLIYGGMVTNVLGYVLKILSDHMNDFDQHNIEMKIIYVRLKRAYHIIRVVSVVTGAALILFGSFD